MFNRGVDIKVQHDFLDRAKYRDWQTVKRMVVEFPEITSANPGGRWSVLHHAAGQGNLEMVDFLLTHDADVSVKASNGDTPLAVAMGEVIKDRLSRPKREHQFLDRAKYGDWTAVKEMVSSASDIINSHPLGRWSVLHHAAGTGNAGMVEYLLAQKADPGIQAKSGETPLAVAVGDAVKKLLVKASLPSCPSSSSSCVKPADTLSPVNKSDSFKKVDGANALDPITSGITPQKRRLSSDSGGARKKPATPEIGPASKNTETSGPVGRTGSIIDLIESSDEEKPTTGKAGNSDFADKSVGEGKPNGALNSEIADTNAKREAFLRLFGMGAQEKASHVKSASNEASPASNITPAVPSASHQLACSVDESKEAPVSSPDQKAKSPTPSLPKQSVICRSSGSFELISAYDFKTMHGSYSFDRETGRLTDDAGLHVGTFSDQQLSPTAFPNAFIQNPGLPASVECVSIVSSEIMEEIQDPKNKDAWFVLPSQLNGVEYPTDKCVVAHISDYKRDKTGGPRGQLAVHPAVGQFLLDNAACSHRPDGINALDTFIPAARHCMHSEAAKKYDVHVKNGYLALPDCLPSIQEEVLMGFRQALHVIRCLTIHDVPACGLDPSLKHRSDQMHRVNLVYASAVPVDAYSNRGKVSRAFQTEVGRLFIVAQYYGALRMAATIMPKESTSLVRVFLMPLGGGVFNNRLETIVSALSTAIELLAAEGVDVSKKLDVRVLAFKGKPQEQTRMATLVRDMQKLRK
eukprot:gnl/MRDRNA2_/MRDRNA2_31098_c0_seq1.p1 gnl/MRDRNA2_/MRDRNA2_31098_c0~~gnl/MRDRNA2_/MRDRNA2_31098_c0_seq1.p1  ORF type:complete len:748 (-),score=140.47 gnl/MRDRNA2_/MRDRNA2_31098_c0_seq1:53-2296(-)